MLLVGSVLVSHRQTGTQGGTIWLACWGGAGSATSPVWGRPRTRRVGSSLNATLVRERGVVSGRMGGRFVASAELAWWDGSRQRRRLLVELASPATPTEELAASGLFFFFFFFWIVMKRRQAAVKSGLGVPGPDITSWHSHPGTRP